MAHGVKSGSTRVATLNPDRMWIGGVMMNEDGCALSSGKGGIIPTEQRSVLYRGRSDVPGLPIAPARFKLG